MNIRQKGRNIWRKIKRFSLKIDRRLPDNWKYYTETGIGVLLTISAIGNFFVPYISILTSLSFLIAGLYTIPDIRFRILYRLEIQPPKYSVPMVLILGLLIGSIGTPRSAIPGPKNKADFQVSSRNLDVFEEKPKKYAVGTAEIRNRGLDSENYTVGIFLDGNLKNRTTVEMSPGDKRSFNLSTAIHRKGQHTVRFFSTRGERIIEENLTGFSITRNVRLPYYLNEENIRTSITGYSPMPQKKFDNITDLEVTSTEDGYRVRLVNRVGNVFDTFDLIKTSAVDSFHASKKIYQNFDNVKYVSTVMKTDYTNPNGTVEIRNALETGLSREDARKIDWKNATGETRFDYAHWLNLTSSYKIEPELCETISKDVECRK